MTLLDAVRSSVGRGEDHLGAARCGEGISSLHLAYRTRVAGQLRIASEQGDAFGESLSEKNAIERIFVQRRQQVDVHGMLTGDWQL